MPSYNLYSFAFMRCFLTILMAGVPVMAAEYAVLANGLRLYADRHEAVGERVRLYRGQGFVELPAKNVLRFDGEDYVPTAAVSPTVFHSATVVHQVSAEELVRRAAIRQGLPPELMLSVAKVESGARSEAVSRKGAKGIMQLMPNTARELGADPWDPEQNANAGAKYLRYLLLKYKEDPYQLRKALAGYNAGPGSVDRYGGVPPYRETMHYVERVLGRYMKLHGKPVP